NAEPLPAGATARLGTTHFRHGDRIFFLAYSPDGKRIVSASADETVRLWDAATGREVRRFERTRNDNALLGGGLEAMLVRQGLDRDRSFPVALAPDGKVLAALRDGTVHVWETSSGKELQRLRSSFPASGTLAFSNDSQSVLLVGPAGGIEAWSVST